MTSTEFAYKWLEKQGLFDPDSDYDGMLGEAVLAIVHVIASQHHSGASAHQLYAILNMIYRAYTNPDDPIWKEVDGPSHPA